MSFTKVFVTTVYVVVSLFLINLTVWFAVFLLYLALSSSFR